jgi:hypothetical protein
LSALPPWQEQPGGLPVELVRALRGAPGEPSQAELELLAIGLNSALGLTVAAQQAPVTAKTLIAVKPALGLMSSTLLGVAIGVGLSAAVAVTVTAGTAEQQPKRAHEAAGTPTVAPSLPPTEVVPMAAEPVSEPRLEVPSHGALRAAPPSASADASPLEAMAAELALLRQARAALGSNPSRALALCADHARMFSGGVLGQEREVIAIEALLRAGRAAEARERGRRFGESFPGSAHARRVASLLEATSQR